ncbi:hypothetical protein COCSUDRAFT_46205 [Coccomyxa subellipsoidea C-169]|uniref:Exportin-4 n=1 Tax=Coccomyxa subellipsoidea (strain C-169) TaxID=574566 RepID=I0Z7V9_COCSC|nr:hypothetical protein COCSUDRAFT_46205 [Coccomyxa subellipsoidea C-169]EIE26728.1 hypothetical protein COCSUDRAFT_46205 [Coccomyxa subellipsoidea C-169]|eukprot:XP_005651272.1 hypothetical protein COCSUDRAFT_46205 [Coccomyxa subellipsoidea C-169]
MQICSIIEIRDEAALTLREAALRRWGITSAEEKRQLRSYILHLIMRNGSTADDIITSQLTAAVASMLKRGWLESSKEEQHAFFAETEDIAKSQGTPGARRASIKVLEAVVTEFSPATASPLGLPWDYHERCRSSLESDYLQSFFVHASGIARGSAAAAVEGRDEGLCQACMSLLTAILSWDFRQGASPIPVYGDGRTTNNSMLVKPDPAWRDTLLSAEAVDWLIALLNARRGQPESPLAAASRQLLVMFCSISGDIFPKAAEQQRAELGLQHTTSAKDAHLQRMLPAILPCIAPPEAALHRAAANNEAELLDACKALAVLAQVHRASGFVRAIVDDRAGEGGVLSIIADLARACISAGGMSEAAEGTWTAEATDLLLDTWVELLYERVGCISQRSGEGPSDAEAAAAAKVFQALTEGALKDAVDCAHLDEEEGEAADDAGVGAMAGREDWFACAAAVGRASAAFSAGLLTKRIQQKQQHLQHCAAAGQDPAEPLEELHWLTRMAAHLLADSGEGETPLVPMSVAAAAAAAQPGIDPVEGLSHALLGVAGLCLDERARPVVSPRLMEAAASGVARWADTYLMAEDPASAGLANAFGLHGGGPAVLQALVQMANVLLSQFAGEVDLHRVVAARLLPVLTQQATICGCLAHLDAWRALVRAFAEQAEPIRALAGPTVRALAKALTVAAGGLPDQAAAWQYTTHLMHTLTEEVSSIAGRPDLAGIAERPDMMARVGYLLEALRGSVRGTCPKAQPALFSVASAIMNPVVSLQRIYHNQPAISCQLLKLAADVVDAHISFVQVKDAKLLCEWVLHLLQQYSTYNLGQVSLAAAARLRAEAAADSYREVRALIKLLMNLTIRDVVDFGGDSDQPGGQVNIAQVVFLGLGLVIPLVTGELLQFPKLVRSFFNLMSYMLEIYPDHVAGLPEAQMRVVLSTLEFGVNSTDLEVVQGSLEALAALASCHHSAVSSGADGIAAPQGGGSLLGGFMELVIRRLLLEDLGKDTLELAADALFPLILSHTAAFQSLGDKLLASQQDPAAQSGLIRAMNELLTTNGIENSTDRANKRRFRANLTKFVVAARSIAGFHASEVGVKRLAARLMADPNLMSALLEDVLQTCQAFLDLAHGIFFSERWLGLSGSELFADISMHLRSLLKDHVLPLICSIITNAPERKLNDAFDNALSEAFQKLLALGAVKRDVLSALISSTREAFSAWSLTTDSNNSKVLRFFLQHVAKVLAANPIAIRPCLSELAAMLAEIQASFISCMDETDAARAQILAEARSALGKVTAELSTWLFAQHDCAELLSEMVSGQGHMPHASADSRLGLIVSILQTCFSAAADVRLMAVRHSTPELARVHIHAMLSAAVNVAILDGADSEFQCLVSPLMGQLVSLTAALISATPDQMRFDICQELLKMVESLASAVEDALKQASAQAIQPPCVLPALCVAEMLCGLQAKRLAENIVQVVEICQRNSQAAALTAAFAAHCDEIQATPTKLFNAMLTEEHWALQHEAMLALLGFARSPSTDFKAVLPRQLCDEGEEPSAAFVQLLMQYMQRANSGDKDTDDRLSTSACASALSTATAGQHTARLQSLAEKALKVSANREQDIIAMAMEGACQDMAKKGQLLRKELSEKTRKAMEFNIFKQGLKESSAVDASLSPAQVADQLKKSLATSKELHTAMESLVENRKKDRSAQDLWNAVLVTAREVLGLWGVGASFILTGNLLAPLAASVAAGTLRSGFTRVQAPKMRRRRAELLSKLEKSMAQKEKEIAAKKDDLSNDEGKASHDE